MRGTLSTETGVLMTDLLSFLGQTHQSGCLSLASGNLRASLNLREGNVLNARYGELFDEHAIAAAMTVSPWSFVLEPVLRNSEKRIKIPISSLLLKCSVQADEERESVDLAPCVLWYQLEGDKAVGGASAQDAELFRNDVVFLQEHVAQLCQILAREEPQVVAMAEPGGKAHQGIVGLNVEGLSEIIGALNEGE